MKYKIFTFLVLLTLTYNLSATASNNDAKLPIENNKKIKQKVKSTNKNVIATINGKPLKLAYIKKKLKEISEAELMGNNIDYDKLDDNAKHEIVKTFIIGKLINKEARKAGLNKTKRFKKILKLEKEQILHRLYIEKMIKENITLDKLKVRYDEYKQHQVGKKEVSIAQLDYNDEKTAQEDYKKISNANDFDKLIQSKSGKNSKELEKRYFVKEQMPTIFADTVFNMQVNQISKPIKSDFGWHILKLVDKRNVQPKSFDNLKDNLKSRLTEEFMEKYIKDILIENNVKINK